jgi:hypothetical protein
LLLKQQKKAAQRLPFFMPSKKKEIPAEKHGFDFAYSTGLQYICPEIIVLK